MTENEPIRESGSAGTIRDNVRYIIRESPVKQEKNRLVCLIDKRCEKAVPTLFQEAQGLAMDNFIDLSTSLWNGQLLKLSSPEAATSYSPRRLQICSVSKL